MLNKNIFLIATVRLVINIRSQYFSVRIYTTGPTSLSNKVPRKTGAELYCVYL
jgi:hypothetical protein